MSILEVFLLAVSLSLDAAVVSVGAGALNRMTPARAFRIAGLFGLFQGLMPVLGFLGGLLFRSFLVSWGRVVGFVLIGIVAFKMLREAFGKEDVEDEKDILHLKTLLLLAFATSIDALVVGITFIVIPVSVPLAAGIIGTVTFFVCLGALYAGRKTKHLLGTKIELAGAFVLFLLAFKILLF